MFGVGGLVGWNLKVPLLKILYTPSATPIPASHGGSGGAVSYGEGGEAGNVTRRATFP